MNAEPPSRESLLDEVFDGADTARAPGVNTVLRIVGAETRRRRKRNRLAASIAIPLVAAAVILTNRPPASVSVAGTAPVPAPPPAQADPPPAAGPAEVQPARIERIDDDTLLRLLDDRPVALATYPDGRQSLLVLTRR